MIPQLSLTMLVLARQARLVDQRTLRILLSLQGFPAHGIKPGFIMRALEMNSGSQARRVSTSPTEPPTSTRLPEIFINKNSFPF